MEGRGSREKGDRERSKGEWNVLKSTAATPAMPGPERGLDQRGVVRAVVLTARGGEGQRSKYLHNRAFDARREGI